MSDACSSRVVTAWLSVGLPQGPRHSCIQGVLAHAVSWVGGQCPAPDPGRCGPPHLLLSPSGCAPRLLWLLQPTVLAWLSAVALTLGGISELLTACSVCHAGGCVLPVMVSPAFAKFLAHKGQDAGSITFTFTTPKKLDSILYILSFYRARKRQIKNPTAPNFIWTTVCQKAGVGHSITGHCPHEKNYSEA